MRAAPEPTTTITARPPARHARRRPARFPTLLLLIVAAGASLGVVGLHPTSASAQADGGAREQARQRFAAGEARFRAGDYHGAITEFEAADALVPSPILAYDLALCHEKLGDDGRAVRLFEDYLARRPDAPNRDDVEQRIAAARARLAAAAPAPAPSPTPAPAPSPAVLEPAAAAAGGVAIDPAFARRVPDRGAGGPSGGAYAPGAEGSATGGEPGATGPATAPTPEDAARAAEGEPAAPVAQAAPKPVYKRWWFWVVVGVSALILIDVATADSGTDEPPRAAAGIAF